MKKNFTPSAKVWNRPQGPARSGPMRFCMSLMSLRSNQIISMTATSRKTKTTTTFSRTMPTSPAVEVTGEEGIHQILSTRTSVTARRH